MRPCRRGRRTPAGSSERGLRYAHGRIAPLCHAAMPPRQANADNRSSAHRAALRRSPVSPPNTAAESANRTDASPRFTTRPAAAAGERRQPLERTSRCASALPQNTAAESANHTDAPPRFAMRPSRNRPPQQANADNRSNAHRAAHRDALPVSPQNTAAESANRTDAPINAPRRRDRRTPTTVRAHIALRFGAPLSPRRTPQRNRRNRTDASPALPRGHAAATGERRPARANAAFDMRTGASPASPRGHAAAAGERRQSLERTSRCAP